MVKFLDTLSIIRELPRGIFFEYRRRAVAPSRPGLFPHSHDFCELHFHHSGECAYLTEHGLYDLTDTSVIFTRPGELHGVRVMEACSYVHSYFYIPTDAFLFLGEPSPMRFFFNRPFGQRNYLRMPHDAAEECRSHLAAICKDATQNETDRSVNALAQLMMILTAINRVLESGSPNAAHAEESNALLSEALRCIHANIGEIGSVDDLARRLYVSREYLSRLFSKTMGITLSRYITLKRIELAKNLLRKGETLSDVSAACGWEDYSYFIHVFHREVGITPAKFRSEKR